jgi:hypothetical protein
MIKFILILSFLGITNFYFSQSYAYSFQGKLASEERTSLLENIHAIPGIASCELRYKLDSERGEFLFYVDQELNKTKEIEFSPVDLKVLFLEYKLEPLDFRLIK